MLNMWVDPDYPPGPMTKLFVVALRDDDPGREWWEGVFARQLEKSDVVATRSHEVLPTAMPDSAAIFDAARRAGCDGVIAIYETYQNSETVYIDGYVTREIIYPDNRIRPFCHAAYYPPVTPGPVIVYTHHPGYYAMETSTRCDVEVWTAPGDVRMVWTGTTDMEMMEPVSDARTGEIVAGWVEWEMLKCGLISGGI